MQRQLDNEIKRRNHIEDSLKASGAPAEALRLLSGMELNTKLANERESIRIRSAIVHSFEIDLLTEFLINCHWF